MPTTSMRDAGLRRVSRLTRWALAGAVVATGVFSAAAARALPGKAKTTGAGDGSGTAGSTGAVTGAASAPGDGSGAGDATVAPLSPSSGVDGSSAAGGGLSAPAQLPRHHRGAASVTSGAS